MNNYGPTRPMIHTGSTIERKPHCISTDLGQLSDYTAITRLELKHPAQYNAPPIHTWPVHMLRCDRVPLRTTYDDIGDIVVQLYQILGGQTHCDLVFDQSGVGKPVVDQVRAKYHVPCIGITIVGGDTEVIEWLGNGNANCHVSKMILISTLVVSMETQRLRIAGDMPGRKLLEGELQNFTTRKTKTGQDTASARIGKHDDMVLSSALGLWWMSRKDPPKIKTMSFRRNL